METILTCLTAPGKAAIASLAVRGPLAWPITRELFTPRKGALPDQPTGGSYWNGKLGKANADEAILTVKDDCLELHCHGGTEIVRLIQELYVERGVKIVSWQQFLDKPILALLAQAPTTRTAAILLDQASGAWASCVTGNPDVERLRRLEELIPLGRHLVEPWRVVIAGAPNVGKSSLMNALAGYTRSIVAPIPGTTRDLVTVRLAIDGWPIEMTDTAGMREASSALEEKGIELARAALRDADLRLWLLDGSERPIFPDERSGWHFLINKIDLPAAWDWQAAQPALLLSAQTRAGMAEVCELISRQLVPRPPMPGDAVPCLLERVELVSSLSARAAPRGR